jgi:hypothetical protein
MREFVGVDSFYIIASKPSPIKREALIFNRIAIPYLGTIKRITEHSNLNRVEIDVIMNELEWLLESGIIFEPKSNLSDEKLLTNDEFKNGLEFDDKLLTEGNKYIASGSVKTLLRLAGNPPYNKPLSEQEEREVLGLATLFFVLAENRTRLISTQLRELEGLDAYPILRTGINSSQSNQANKCDVVQIILNSLPIPDDSTSWEQILEYRSDLDSQHRFLDLRNWMNEVARGRLSVIEIEQKLEHLISQYQRHMKLHKMKTNTGTLETYLTIGFEFLEELLRLKLSKAVKALFSLKHRRIALMEGELTSPGSEVAYVIKAREMFPNSGNS